MKTCLSCDHSWKPFNRVATCSRKKRNVDVVGEPIGDHPTCYFERTNWPRFFGRDTCGKEARYWTPERPRVPPGHSKPLGSPPGILP